MSKRILSLVLALVMVLGTFGTVFADTAEVTLDPKVQWLVEQGLLQGDGSGNLDLDKAITRDVLARIVAVALEDEKSADSLKALPSGFADMTPAHWANGYASYANAKGYMVGNEKTEFMPAAVVNYDQALVVLTKIALGGDLTEAEKANSLTWYAPYVAKANELGVTEGVSILNVGAPAVKEDIVKMLYNVLNNKDFGNYNVLKVVVLENDRIARLGENEVTVEVMKEVQRANFVDASRKDLKGEQYTYELPAKFNAEDLLGKVVDLSINKEGKVVEVKEDTTFEVKTGKVTDITASRLTIDKKEYIVNLDEGYNKEDERVYRTYLNDKDVKYTDFAKNNEEVEYARVTVKAGKVVFVDAYNFDDIMPVKDIKVVREKDTIVSYDDVRDGNVLETTVSKDRVILVNGKTFTRGTLENVKVDNVIHTYKVGTATKYVVLQDAAIEGKLDRITETKTVTSVVVDDKAYAVPTADAKKAVYEFKSNDRFYTLNAKEAYRELDTFRGEEVRVLLGLDGKVQYIGSKVEFADFVGVATRIVGRDMRVLNPENKLNDYEANLDTKVVAKAGTTGHQNLNLIDIDSLVYVNANEKALVKVVDLDNRINVKSLDKRNIELTSALQEKLANNTIISESNFRITDETAIYVVNSKGVAEVRTIADVVKAWDANEKLTSGKTIVKASLVSETKFDNMSVRGNKFARDNNAQAVVLYGLNIAPEKKDGVYGKLVRVYDRKGSNSEILVELSSGREVRFLLSDDVNVNFELGQYYVIEESKVTEGLAIDATKVVFKEGTVTAINGLVYTLAGEAGVFYEVKATEFFGVRKPRVNDKISYVLNDKYTRDFDLIVYGEAPAATISGLVTYIDASKFEVEIQENGKITMYTVTGSARSLFTGTNSTNSTFDGAVVGDDVKALFTDGRLTGLEIVKTRVAKLAEAQAAANLAITKLTYKAASSIDNATKLADAQSQYNAAKAASDAFVVLGGTTGTLTNFADIAAQKTEIDRYIATKAVTDAKAALELGLATGDTIATVTKNITLKAADAGVVITWVSSNAAVSNAGVVTRPAHPNANETGNLTATIKSTLVSSITDTKAFSVTVIAATQTDLQKAEADKAALVLGFNTPDTAATSVTKDLILATTGTNGSVITWSSNNIDVVANDGTVTQPATGSPDVTVTLTATIKLNQAIVTKVFTVIVEAQ